MNHKDHLVIDDFLDKEYLKALEEFLTSPTPKWSYILDSITPTAYTQVGPSFSIISHMIYVKGDKDNDAHMSEYFYLFEPLIECIKEYLPPNADLLRCRASTTFLTNSLPPMGHTDYVFDNISVVMYLGESDGSTYICEEKDSKDPEHISGIKRREQLTILKEVEHVRNRLLIFHGNDYHIASPPKHHDSRLIINANFVFYQEDLNV